MSIQSIEQKRAQYALKKVQMVNPKNHSDWLSRANEMPAMIQMNGLGQTVAFYLSKGVVHGQMYDLLSDWLEKDLKIYSQPLINGITDGDMQTYRMAQAEAQALLIWVKKFSKAFCKE